VEPTSIAEQAGIRVGDRIIELDGVDVSTRGSSVIKNMARASKNSPPAISVQSYCQQVELIANDRFFSKPLGMNGFGFTVGGDLPVLVEQVYENSPAYVAGMRTGEFFLLFLVSLSQSCGLNKTRGI
jgi:C-terminal processing protease CtpA/Prc